jgi:chorismate synthase
MRSNRLSSYLGFTTFGESHGPAFGLVIEDVSPGVSFPYSELSHLLALRKPGNNPYASSRQEDDDYQVLSGVFEGKTTGMPICILFWNKDANSKDYEKFKHIFRPGHADYSLFSKFKIYDYRGGGRASGRETICRVAASAFVSDFIKPISIKYNVVQIGSLNSKGNTQYYYLSEDNPFCWSGDLLRLHSYLDEIKDQKDTVGGLVKILIENVPSGLGDPVFEKLNANLAKAIFSIGTIKGVSFGDGFEIIAKKGSDANEQMNSEGFISNHSGGIVGGISTGQDIVINVAIKPISSHGKLQKTINHDGHSEEIIVTGRHDVCHIPRMLPVIDAMIKLTLADALSHQKLISGDTQNLEDYREAIDKLDEDLLLIIHRRKMLVELVSKLKKEQNIEFRDPERESALESRWIQIGKELGLHERDLSVLLSQVLKICRNDNSDNSL